LQLTRKQGRPVRLPRAKCHRAPEPAKRQSGLLRPPGEQLVQLLDPVHDPGARGRREDVALRGLRARNVRRQRSHLRFDLGQRGSQGRRCATARDELDEVVDPDFRAVELDALQGLPGCGFRWSDASTWTGGTPSGWATSRTCGPGKAGCTSPVITDVYSRKVVGWRLRERMTAELVCEALDAAVRARRPPNGLVFHSDCGSQYASRAIFTPG
jgi:transposase InsO family protein